MLKYNDENNSKETFSNVRVTVRVKPCPQDMISIVSKVKHYPKLIKMGDDTFSFDHIKWGNESQERVYKVAAYPFVEKALEGYSATILAIGQTGSGKSYTMGSLVSMTNSWRNSGLIQRSLKHIFEQSNIEVSASFIEIYNEELHDLLRTGAPIIMHKSEKINLKTEQISSFKEGLSLIRKALELRQERVISSDISTSQSHAILTLHLRVNYGKYSRKSKLNLVDLAGMRTVERMSIPSDEPHGVRCCINRGLFALDKVITAMSEIKDTVPILYKDSLLTIILKDSFDTKSQISVVACISPDLSDYKDDLKTLQFAKRAKLVEINPTRSNVSNSANHFADQLETTTRQLSVLLSPLSSDTPILKKQCQTVKTPTECKIKNCTVLIKKSDVDFNKYSEMQEHKENIAPLNRTDDKTNIQSSQVSLVNNEVELSLASTVSIGQLETQSIHETSKKIDSTSFHRCNCATDLKDDFLSLNSECVMTQDMKLELSGSVLPLDDQCQYAAFDLQLFNDFNDFDNFLQCNDTEYSVNYQDSGENKIEQTATNPYLKQRTENSKQRVEMQSCSTSQDSSSSDQFYEKPGTCNVAKNQIKRMNAVLTSNCSQFSNKRTPTVRRFDEATQLSQIDIHNPKKFMRTDEKRLAVTLNHDENLCKSEDQSIQGDYHVNGGKLNLGRKDKKLAHGNNILRILNSGNPKQLATLPQIGNKTALVIYHYRLMNGDFKSLKDLENIPAWSKKFCDKFFAANNIQFK